jgi:hypothetical protein
MVAFREARQTTISLTISGDDSVSPARGDAGMNTSTQARTLLTIDPTPEAPRNSEGAIVELRGGRLLLAYSRFTGGNRDESTAHIACRTSDDRGRTWSEDRALQESVGDMNVMSVSLLRLSSGDILFGYAVKNAWDDCRFYLRRSSDEMQSLGEPVCATPEKVYHVVNNDRLVQLGTGRLLVPAALHACPDGTRATWSPRAAATCYYSDDDGRSWNRIVGSSAIPDDVETGTGLQEPGVVELADGRVLLWARTDLGSQYQAVSEDGGETWSEPRPGPLISPRSPASIKRLPVTGDLLAVWNDHSGKHPHPGGHKRTPLCTAVSRNEGRTWEDSKVLEADPDGWYCYTSMSFVADAVLLGYCAGDSQVGGLNRLRITRVPQDWLYAGA